MNIPSTSLSRQVRCGGVLVIILFFLFFLLILGYCQSWVDLFRTAFSNGTKNIIHLFFVVVVIFFSFSSIITSTFWSFIPATIIILIMILIINYNRFRRCFWRSRPLPPLPPLLLLPLLRCPIRRNWRRRRKTKKKRKRKRNRRRIMGKTSGGRKRRNKKKDACNGWYFYRFFEFWCCGRWVGIGIFGVQVAPSKLFRYYKHMIWNIHL